MKILAWAMLVLALVLIAARAYLPIHVSQLINNSIETNQSISGLVQDVDISLFGCSIELVDLEIRKTETSSAAANNRRKESPILTAASVKLSSNWGALFNGNYDGDVVVQSPVINIVDGLREEDTQTGAEIRWRRVLKKIRPMRINRFQVKDGRLHFKNFDTSPTVDLVLHDIEVDAQNISESFRADGPKPASLSFKGNTDGNGSMEIDSQLSLGLNQVEGDLDLKIESLDLTAVNDFFKSYAKIEVENGQIDLNASSQLIETNQIADINGEIVLIGTNLKARRWEPNGAQAEAGVLLSWEGVAQLAKLLLETGQQDKLKTTIPISGDVSSPELDISSATWNMLKNTVSGWFSD